MFSFMLSLFFGKYDDFGLASPNSPEFTPQGGGPVADFGLSMGIMQYLIPVFRESGLNLCLSMGYYFG